MNLLELLLFFLIAYIFIFVIDYFFICKKGKKRKSFRITSEGNYLIRRFNLDETKINIKQLDFHISLINGFIISFVSVTISIFNNSILLEFLIGFVLLFLLIYAIYEIYGRILVKKWGKEDGI